MGKYLNAVGVGTKDFFQTQWNAVTLSPLRSAFKPGSRAGSHKRRGAARLHKAWDYMDDDEQEFLIFVSVVGSIYRNLTPIGVLHSFCSGFKEGYRTLVIDKNREDNAVYVFKSNGMSEEAARKVVRAAMFGDLDDVKDLSQSDKAVLERVGNDALMAGGGMINF